MYKGSPSYSTGGNRTTKDGKEDPSAFTAEYCKNNTLVDLNVNVNMSSLNNVITHILRKLEENSRDIREVEATSARALETGRALSQTVAQQEQDVSKLKDQSTDHETRISILEGKGGGGTLGKSELDERLKNLNDKIDHLADDTTEKFKTLSSSVGTNRHDILLLQQADSNLQAKLDDIYEALNRRMDDLLRMLNGDIEVEHTFHLPGIGEAGDPKKGSSTFAEGGPDGTGGGTGAGGSGGGGGEGGGMGLGSRDGTPFGSGDNLYDNPYQPRSKSSSPESHVSNEEAARRAEKAKMNIPHLLQLARDLPNEINKLKKSIGTESDKLDTLYNMVTQPMNDDINTMKKQIRTLQEQETLLEERANKAQHKLTTLNQWKKEADETVTKMQEMKADKSEVEDDLKAIRDALSKHDDLHTSHAKEFEDLRKLIDDLQQELNAHRKENALQHDELQNKIDVLVGKINDILGVLVLFENKLWDEEKRMGQMASDLKQQKMKSKQIENVMSGDGAMQGTGAHSSLGIDLTLLGGLEPLIRKRSAFRCLSCDRPTDASEQQLAMLQPTGSPFANHVPTRPQVEKGIKGEKERELREKIMKEARAEAQHIAYSASVTETRSVTSPGTGAQTPKPPTPGTASSTPRPRTAGSPGTPLTRGGSAQIGKPPKGSPAAWRATSSIAVPENIDSSELNGTAADSRTALPLISEPASGASSFAHSAPNQQAQ
eukprot:TRINITY_DN66252_c2_g1_i1.p1 TRINITY_DN66252_c2_g1~~TRINITY_DN66252_c2_g1_i1.p1  ORF type:complete len:717 (+),score=92.50 TRINITY_DN66252_c2_g1_i1:45-2195(+)